MVPALGAHPAAKAVHTLARATINVFPDTSQLSLAEAIADGLFSQRQRHRAELQRLCPRATECFVLMGCPECFVLVGCPECFVLTGCPESLSLLESFVFECSCVTRFIEKIPRFI